MYTEKLPSGKYRCVMNYQDPLTGKNRRVSITIEKNTREARKEAELILDHKIDLIYEKSLAKTEISKMTFGILIDRYREYQQERVKPSTWKRNFHAQNTMLSILGKDTLLSQMNAGYVRSSLDKSVDNNCTKNEFLKRFKAIMRFAYQEEYVDDVRWLDRLQRYPDRAHRLKIQDKYLEAEELQSLISELQIPINRMMIQFLALSGIRIGEAIALEKTDIDLSDRMITVDKTWCEATKEVLSTKTEMSERKVYMQDELLELVRDIRKYNMHVEMACGFRTTHFFSDLEGNRINIHSINKYFKENCERILGRHLTLHSLRHTHASLMSEKGMSLEAIASRLGHADSKITKDIYLHITDTKRNEFNEALKEIKLLS